MLWLHTGIQTFVLKKPLSYFSNWRKAVLEKVKHQIKRTAYKGFNNVLSKPNVKNYLATLHDKYVFVPVDKAANNVSIICKKYYLQVLSNEVQNTPTFAPYNSSVEEIIKMHESVIQGEYNIDITDEHKSLPYIYWLPKFHKEVVGFRFITAGKLHHQSFINKYWFCT